ncbi:MAG: hypothetical protein WAR37_01180 [Candidatus Microsaccharimonas sp.]
MHQPNRKVFIDERELTGDSSFVLANHSRPKVMIAASQDSVTGLQYQVTSELSVGKDFISDVFGSLVGRNNVSPPEVLDGLKQIVSGARGGKSELLASPSLKRVAQASGELVDIMTNDQSEKLKVFQSAVLSDEQSMLYAGEKFEDAIRNGYLNEFLDTLKIEPTTVEQVEVQYEIRNALFVEVPLRQSFASSHELRLNSGHTVYIPKVQFPLKARNASSLYEVSVGGLAGMDDVLEAETYNVTLFSQSAGLEARPQLSWDGNRLLFPSNERLGLMKPSRPNSLLAAAMAVCALDVVRTQTGTNYGDKLRSDTYGNARKIDARLRRKEFLSAGLVALSLPDAQIMSKDYIINAEEAVQS